MQEVMQFKRRYVCAIFLILLYLFLRNVFFEIKDEESPLLDNKFLPSRIQNSSLDTSWIRKNVTVMLRYVGGSGFHLSRTVNWFAETFTNINILVVSDSVVSSPTVTNISKSANVKFIHTKIDLMNIVVDRNPLNYVKTKYLLAVPLGVVGVTPQQVVSMMAELGNTGLLVLSLANKKSCMAMDLNLREWTLEIHHGNKFENTCDYVLDDAGFLVKTLELRNIAEPFMVPFPESLFIQAKAVGMMAKLSKIDLKQSLSYKLDDHMKQFLHHQRLYMYLLFGIKKVVRETGTTEWYGCTRQSSRCFGTVVDSMPQYLYQGKWTPPCCLKLLRETARHVFQTLNKYKVRYWLEGGSLLGAMRMKDIIPWDYDVDIGIYQEDIHKCPWLAKAHKSSKKVKTAIVDEEGYVWETAKTEEGTFFRVQTSAINTLHVDIFPFYSRNGIMTKDTWFLSHPQDREFPEHFLKPLTTVEFINVNASAPNNIREFLEFKFGKGCVENPQYPNPKIMPFPKQKKSEELEEYG